MVASSLLFILVRKFVAHFSLAHGIDKRPLPNSKDMDELVISLLLIALEGKWDTVQKVIITWTHDGEEDGAHIWQDRPLIKDRSMLMIRQKGVCTVLLATLHLQLTFGM